MSINRLLTDTDRIQLSPTIKLMWNLCPTTMKRKIERANVQQAFVFDRIINYYKEDNTILSVGCYDDTAFEASVITYGYAVEGIDPQINFDLHTFRQNYNVGFDIVFSTSVIEHVKDDEEFVKDICDLLLPGGYGILTMDFNNNYKVGDSLPATDLRFYTKYDLDIRLRRIIESKGCELVEESDWVGEPEFFHDGCSYSFATFVFRKKKNV